MVDQQYVINGGERGVAGWMYGACDQNHHGKQREAAMYSWWPSTDDDDCDALRKGQPELPATPVLARSLCERWAGETILLVGDSLTYTLFIAFAKLFGVVPRVRCESHCDPCFGGLDAAPAQGGGVHASSEAQLCRCPTADPDARARCSVSSCVIV